MNRRLSPVILICTLLIVLFSCSGKSQRSRKPIITISLNPVERHYKLGSNIEVKVNTTVRNGEIKEVKIYYQNELLTTSNSEETVVTLENVTKLGSNLVKVEAVKTDGVSNTSVKNFSVISDIQPKSLTYTIVNEYPHSTNFFTQGLEIHDNYVYESTGQNGKSGIYKVHLQSGRVEQLQMLNEKYFGEGITILNNKIYQLTYKSHMGFVYDLSDFALIDSFQIASSEGWGLTNDGENLIMSDGSNRLTWLDAENYSIIKTLYVADDQSQLQQLNELEYINGTIYANLWTEYNIIEIDPESGKVLSTIDLSGLMGELNINRSDVDVLNGIAYFEETGNLLVTGKWWPKLAEIKLSE